MDTLDALRDLDVPAVTTIVVVVAVAALAVLDPVARPPPVRRR